MVTAFHSIGLWFLAALLEINGSGAYPSLTLSRVIWTAALTILGVSAWKMGLSGTVRYSVKHSTWLLTAALAGIATSLMLVAPWAPRTFQLPAPLISEPGIISLALTIALGLIVTSRKLVDYWRRYLRTLCIPDPPAQPTFVVSTAVVLSGSIFLFYATPFSVSISPPKVSLLLLELGLWVVGPLLTAALVPEGKVPLPAAAEEKRNRRDYSDTAIATDEEDLLGRREFAQRLAGEIITLPWERLIRVWTERALG